jgi:acyl dehydratase
MSRPAAPRQPGAALPEVVRACDGVRSVQHAGATENYHRIHWDDAYAREEGLPRAIVNNGLLLVWLERLLEDTYGPDALLCSLRARYRAPVLLDEPVHCGGVVVRATTVEATTRLELDIWVRDGAGQSRVEGQAAVEVRV